MDECRVNISLYYHIRNGFLCQSNRNALNAFSSNLSVERTIGQAELPSRRCVAFQVYKKSAIVKQAL